jgi:exopolysaccharide biosynthesis polyprenyl glycosylphosphotransferase
VNHKQEISKDLPMLADGLLMGLCLWLSYLLRVSLNAWPSFFSEIPPFSTFLWMVVVVIPLTPLILDLNGYYENPVIRTFESILPRMLKGGIWLALIITLSSILSRLEVPSRTVLIFFFFLAPAALITRLTLTKKILLRKYERGELGEESAIIGTSVDADVFLGKLNPTELLSLRIKHRFNIDEMDAETIRRNLREHPVGRVIFVSAESPKNESLPMESESEGMEVWIVTNQINGIVGTPQVSTAGTSRILVFHRTRSEVWYNYIKRVTDIIGALVGLILLSPLLIVIALTVKFTSPGPVIFKQVRSGKRGKRFTIFKFRSMVDNASELHENLHHQNEMEGPVFKITKDPRVTPVGAFLRRTSLDEFPQLWNVLRGEMSFVGPRPLPDYETKKIEVSAHRRRLSVKPGLTCLWQIKGRSSITSFEEWVNLDLEYIDHATFALDLWIILRTVPVVIFRSGAH